MGLILQALRQANKNSEEWLQISHLTASSHNITPELFMKFLFFHFSHLRKLFCQDRGPDNQKDCGRCRYLTKKLGMVVTTGNPFKTSSAVSMQPHIKLTTCMLAAWISSQDTLVSVQWRHGERAHLFWVPSKGGPDNPAPHKHLGQKLLHRAVPGWTADILSLSPHGYKWTQTPAKSSSA